MRRVFASLSIIAMILAFIGTASSPAGAAVPWIDVTCVNGGNNATLIEQSLANNNVRLHGWCGVDWSRLTANANYWKGVEVPNDRELKVMSDAILYLRANQAVIPYDPIKNIPSTEFGDIVVNKTRPATGIAITGPGYIDGMAADQTGGNGYDGVQLHQASNSTVWGVKIRNIRGVNGAGGPTESFAVNILESQGNVSVVDVQVTTTSEAHRLKSASGIATNLGSGVTILNSNVSNLRARCYTSWETSNVTRRNNVASNCGGAAFGTEFGRGHLDENNRYTNSTYGLDLLSVTDYVGRGMYIAGYSQFGIRFNGGCTNVEFNGDIYGNPPPYFGGNPAGCAYRDNLVKHPPL